jgi:hypothetical protein
MNASRELRLCCQNQTNLTMKALSKILILTAILFIFWNMASFAQSTEIRPGIVLPQMTTAQRTALSATNGMLVFDTNTQSYWLRSGGAWTELPKTAANTNFWQQDGLAGNEIKNTNSGGVWSLSSNPIATWSDDITNPPTAPTWGAGTRLMWIPSRAAFRVGAISPLEFGGNINHWDANNIGIASFASGFNTTASTRYSTAMGFNSTASGGASTAIGYEAKAIGDVSTCIGVANTARGRYSTALGYGTNADGWYSTAMGYNTFAGYSSTAMGEETNASGGYATAMGYRTTASGDHSTATGYYTTASGPMSTALGYRASTNGKIRSFVIGGHSFDPSGSGIGPQVANDADYQMMMLFHTYKFWTQNSGKYVAFSPNGEVNATGAYTNVSDRRLKRNFVPLTASLSNLSRLQTYHYYWKTDSTSKDLQTGLIAQELREIFPELVHEDDKGMLSVNYVGLIPHLIEAVKELKAENETLTGFFGKKIAELEAHNDDLSATSKKINAQFNLIQHTNR